MQVRDPVCGMMIEETEAEAKSSYEGSFYYFCSAECKRAFDEHPERYVEKASEAPAH